MSPKDVKRYSDVSKLERDHVSTKHAWILFDTNHIVIANQKSGEPVTGTVTLTKRDFRAFVKWWEGK